MLLDIAEGGYFVAGFAALADLAPPARAGEAFSFGSVALYLGIAIGPVGGRYLLDVGGFGAVWIAAACDLGGSGRARHDRCRPAPTGVRAHRWMSTADLPAGGWPCSAVSLPRGDSWRSLDCMPMPWACRSGAEEPGRSPVSPLRRAMLVLIVCGAVVVGCRVALAKQIDRWPPLIVAGSALALCAGLMSSGDRLALPHHPRRQHHEHRQRRHGAGRHQRLRPLRATPVRAGAVDFAYIADTNQGAYDDGWLGQHERGTEHTAGLGYTEMGARVYHPTTGLPGRFTLHASRFTSIDPVEGGGAND